MLMERGTCRFLEDKPTDLIDFLIMNINYTKDTLSCRVWCELKHGISLPTLITPQTNKSLAEFLHNLRQNYYNQLSRKFKPTLSYNTDV